MSTREQLFALAARAAVGHVDLPISIDDAAIPAIVALAGNERLLPLAAHGLQHLPDEWKPDGWDELVFATARDAVLIEASMLEAHGLLSADGIRVMAIKGIATAHLDYDDPGLRQVGDGDILVPYQQHLDAIDILSGAGWIAPSATLPSHRDAVHAVPMRGPLGRDVDVHQHLAPRALGVLLDQADFFAHATTFELGDTRLGAPSVAHRLLHAAVHYEASPGRYKRLSGLVDVLLIAHRHAVNSSELCATADELGLRFLLERALRRASALSGLALPAEWVDAFARPCAKPDRLLVAAYNGETRRPVLEELAYIRLAGGPVDKVRYLSGYFRTDAAYRERFQRGGLWSQARYLASRVRSRS